MFKRGTLVKRKDNGQCGVVYKTPKGDILSVMVTSTTGRGKTWWMMSNSPITTWHRSQAEQVNSLNKVGN